MRTWLQWKLSKFPTKSIYQYQKNGNFRGRCQYGRGQFRSGPFQGRPNNQGNFQFPRTNSRSTSNFQRSSTNNIYTYQQDCERSSTYDQDNVLTL